MQSSCHKPLPTHFMSSLIRFLVSCTMDFTYWLIYSDKPRVFVLYMENDYDNSSNKILSFSTIRFVKSSYKLQFFGIAKAYNDKEPK